MIYLRVTMDVLGEALPYKAYPAGSNSDLV